MNFCRFIVLLFAPNYLLMSPNYKLKCGCWLNGICKSWQHISDWRRSCVQFLLLNWIIILNVPFLFVVYDHLGYFIWSLFSALAKNGGQNSSCGPYPLWMDAVETAMTWVSFPERSFLFFFFITKPEDPQLLAQGPKLKLEGNEYLCFSKVNALIFCNSITGNVHIFIIFLTLSTGN